jgi:hypothetical protein
MATTIAALRYLRRDPSALGVATNQRRAFTSLTHHPSVEYLVRASKRDLGLAAFSMHRDDDLTFASLFMLVSVKATAALGQPFCRPNFKPKVDPTGPLSLA